MSLVLIDCRLEINATNLSAYTTAVELPVEYEALEDTAMGGVARTRKGGLQDSTIKLGFNQDFGAGGPDATFWPIRNTAVVVKVRPTTAAISATNPEYVGTFLVNDLKPFANKVGELAVMELSWPLSLAAGIARNTS